MSDTPTAMTAEEERKQRAAQCQEDLDDIKNLLEEGPFKRYFLRRLKSKQAQYEFTFRNNVMGKNERERIRRIIKEYDEILVMMASDRKAAKSELAQLTPQSDRPTGGPVSSLSRGAQA